MAELDNVNLSERGEASAASPATGSPISASATLQGTEFPFPEAKENEDDTPGHTGIALYKKLCREWCFFPALEAEFSLALGFWAAGVRNTFQELKLLERENQAQGLEDYKQHRPNGEFGARKEELMNRLTVELKEFSTLFNSANGIMHQHAPNVTVLNEFRGWCFNRLGLDPSDSGLAAENYKALGPRPSMIDEFLHSVVKNTVKLWIKFRSFIHRLLPTKSTSPAPVSIVLGYTTLHILSHLLVVVLAVVFFAMPLCVMYMAPLKKADLVIVTISFSLLFCVGSFYFGGGSGGLKTDTKFLLLFAYTSVMATLLSNLAPHQELQQGQNCACIAPS
ncbi:hypothetical protein QBC40DRAFT_281507 [Triangularia verruculosa]|uniref:DUF6594 domain-containing protein n=1 Tax=Triangularia verruculosa TaxID=2587418 RepID=A0AAN7ASP3_9PEZI|nr:hypothetical protein QBC40DRAFT_281507 [Triangularia verruculosa]